VFPMRAMPGILNLSLPLTVPSLSVGMTKNSVT
jgi:hypothetical protein